MRELEAMDRHMERESDFPDDIHPDGCFYCGSDHPSDVCPSPEKDRFWDEFHDEAYA